MSFNSMDEVFPPQPDAILGRGREQLPEEYRSVFLPGDLVLFRDPGPDAPSLSGKLFSSSPAWPGSPSDVPDWMVFLQSL